MLVVYTQNDLQLAHVDENINEPIDTLGEKLASMLKSLYGETTNFDFHVQTGIMLSDLHDSTVQSFDVLVIDGDKKLVITKIINVTTDKTQITANGTDTATITATVNDATSTETIELYHGEMLVDSKSAVNGVATFEITMTEVGTLTLTVKSTTKYGKADVTIEGV
jgi:hypothetical protein